MEILTSYRHVSLTHKSSSPALNLQLLFGPQLRASEPIGGVNAKKECFLDQNRLRRLSVTQ